MNDDRFEPVAVQCYAGYRGEEEPRRFHWQGREHLITGIVDRWLDPAHRYFKVRSDDDHLYILRHDYRTCQWTIMPLRQ